MIQKRMVGKISIVLLTIICFGLIPFTVGYGAPDGVTSKKDDSPPVTTDPEGHLIGSALDGSLQEAGRKVKSKIADQRSAWADAKAAKSAKAAKAADTKAQNATKAKNKAIRSADTATAKAKNARADAAKAKSKAKKAIQKAKAADAKAAKSAQTAKETGTISAKKKSLKASKAAKSAHAKANKATHKSKVADARAAQAKQTAKTAQSKKHTKIQAAETTRTKATKAKGKASIDAADARAKTKAKIKAKANIKTKAPTGVPDAPAAPKTARAEWKAQTGRQKIGTVMGGIDIANTAQDVQDMLEGTQSVGRTAVKVIDRHLTAGALQTVENTKKKFDDHSAASSILEKGQKTADEGYNTRMEWELKRAGVKAAEAKSLIEASKKGDRSALDAKINEIEKKSGKKFNRPERYNVGGVQADDTAGERAVQVLSGMKDDAVNAGKFIGNTAVNLGTMVHGTVTEKGVYTELEGQTIDNIKNAPGAIADLWAQNSQKNSSDAERVSQGQKITDRLINSGVTPAKAEQAGKDWAEGKLDTAKKLIETQKERVEKGLIKSGVNPEEAKQAAGLWMRGDRQTAKNIRKAAREKQNKLKKEPSTTESTTIEAPIIEPTKIEPSTTGPTTTETPIIEPTKTESSTTGPTTTKTPIIEPTKTEPLSTNKSSKSLGSRDLAAESATRQKQLINALVKAGRSPEDIANLTGMPLSKVKALHSGSYTPRNINRAAKGGGYNPLSDKGMGFSPPNPDRIASTNKIIQEFSEQGPTSLIPEKTSGTIGDSKDPTSQGDYASGKIGQTLINKSEPKTSGQQSGLGTPPDNTGTGGLSSVTVDNQNITLTFWDHGTEDGDIINIYLNGASIRSGILLKNAKQQIQVQLHSGKNIFEVEAVNEGSVSPNTASVHLSNVIAGKDTQISSRKSGQRASMNLQAP